MRERVIFFILGWVGGGDGGGGITWSKTWVEPLVAFWTGDGGGGGDASGAFFFWDFFS